mgnify:CR=1 FL=1
MDMDGLDEDAAGEEAAVVAFDAIANRCEHASMMAHGVSGECVRLWLIDSIQCEAGWSTLKMMTPLVLCSFA